MGPLRINARRRNEAYVSVPGLGCDVYIEGACGHAGVVARGGEGAGRGSCIGAHYSAEAIAIPRWLVCAPRGRLCAASWASYFMHAQLGFVACPLARMHV